MNVPKLGIVAGAVAVIGGGFGVYVYAKRKRVESQLVAPAATSGGQSAAEMGSPLTSTTPGGKRVVHLAGPIIASVAAQQGA